MTLSVLVDRMPGMLVNMNSEMQALATTVRGLRLQRGLSTVELSHRAGMSRATLTQIEAGGGNPTLETLYALANAFDVALADLITTPRRGGPPRVVRSGEGPHVVGDAVEAWLLDTVTSVRSSLEIYDFRLHGTAAQHSAGHPQGTREHLHLYAGRARVGPAAEPIELSAGDYVTFDASQEHIYQRIGRADVRGSLFITRSDT
jgi:transcriptional regulator with XRE-family HTH domain